MLQTDQKKKALKNKNLVDFKSSLIVPARVRKNQSKHQNHSFTFVSPFKTELLFLDMYL